MKQRISSPSDIYSILNTPLKEEVQENLIVFTLNAAGNILGQHWLCKGSDVAVHIPVKLICRQALLDVACGVIIAHNHPSGYASPSRADIEQTAKLKDALGLFDIKLMDHIVIGQGQYYSFSEERMYEDS